MARAASSKGNGKATKPTTYTRCADELSEEGSCVMVELPVPVTPLSQDVPHGGAVAWTDEAARAVLLNLRLPDLNFEEAVFQAAAIISRHAPQELLLRPAAKIPTNVDWSKPIKPNKPRGGA